MKRSPESRAITPEARIGHVHLKVADLGRAIRFYRDVLGFAVTQRYGDQAAFLAAGGYHHHVGLNTWGSAGGSVPPATATGLYHLAILCPKRADLADALRWFGWWQNVHIIVSGLLHFVFHGSQRDCILQPGVGPLFAFERAGLPRDTATRTSLNPERVSSGR
jgi:catechol-2,3-dioxygenase